MAEVVRIIFEGDNSRVLQAAKEIDTAIAATARNAGNVGTSLGNARTSAGAVATSVEKIDKSVQSVNASAKKVDTSFRAQLSSVKGVADGIKGVAGAAMGYLGTAGLIIGAITTIIALTAEWAAGTAEVEKQAEETRKEHEQWLYQQETEQVDAQRRWRDAADAREHNRKVRESEVAFENRAREKEALDLESTARTLDMQGVSQMHVNDLLRQALDLRLANAEAEDALLDRFDVNKGREVEAIKRQIAELEARAGVAAASEQAGRQGPGREIAPSQIGLDDIAIVEGLEQRADEVNQRRLESLEAERAAMAELEALRLAGELDLLATQEGNGARVHSLRMEQIAREARERDAQLAAQQQALAETGTGDALDRLRREDQIRQLAHDREMGRMQADIEMRREVAAESRRIADEQAAALERQLDMLGEIGASIESVAGDFSSRVGEFASARMAQDAAEVEAVERNLQRRGDAQLAALDREIAASRGNAQRMAALQSARAKLEADTAKRIEKVKSDHAAKADRIERAQKGGMMLLEGALSTVKAATSYPNIPAMVTHAAAAALAFTFGAMTLAGGFPGAGGGGAGASISSGGGASGNGTSMQFGEAARTPGSTGTSAPTTGPRLARTGGEVVQAGAVYYGNVTYNANGSIDAAAAEAYGLDVGKSARSREGVGRQ